MVLRKFTGKHLCQSLFFNKVVGLRPATLFKKRLWHRYFPVNFVKFLRIAFFIEHLWWLLLNQGKQGTYFQKKSTTFCNIPFTKDFLLVGRVYEKKWKHPLRSILKKRCTQIKFYGNCSQSPDQITARLLLKLLVTQLL